MATTCDSRKTRRTGGSPGHLDAVLVRQIDVEYQHIGVVPGNEAQCGCAVLAVGEDEDVLCPLRRHPHPGADNGVIVNDDGQRTRTKRRYDDARTPFDRVCETNAIPDQRRAQLTKLRDQTNPRQILAEIRELIDHIFSLPNAEPGDAQNVYDTLGSKNDRKPAEPELR